MKQKQGLKLRANDEEDFDVVSSFLQDAVISVKEMVFLQNEGRFVFVANRFCWENLTDKQKIKEEIHFGRVHCGVCFETVTKVMQMGINRRKKTQILSLLSINAKDNLIELLFSAGVVIRIEVKRLLCHLQDLDEPWPTLWRPKHLLNEE